MVNEKKKLKLAVISGASHAIRFKEHNPKATEDDVIKHVAKKANEIVSKIDN